MESVLQGGVQASPQEPSGAPHGLTWDAAGQKKQTGRGMCTHRKSSPKSANLGFNQRGALVTWLHSRRQGRAGTRKVGGPATDGLLFYQPVLLAWLTGDCCKRGPLPIVMVMH